MQPLIDGLSIATLRRCRDAAVIVTLALIGLRPAELSALDFDDFQPIAGVINVPEKPGCTPREISLEGFAVVRQLLERWVWDARITNGPLFRGFHRSNSLRRKPLSVRSIDQILEAYPITVEGEARTLNPLELRRFAARLLARKDYTLEAMCQRLGVSQSQTVIDYLGGQLPNHLASEPPMEFYTLMSKVLRR